MIGERAAPGQPAAALFDRGERGRLKERTLDVGDDRPVALAVVAGLYAGEVRQKRFPYPLAFGERFPRKQVVQVVVAVADQHGPKAGLADAVLFPELERVILKPLEQLWQAARKARINAQLVDHRFLSNVIPVCAKRQVRNDRSLNQPALIDRSFDER